MYLKSLVLKGFKSFADRSVLALEPGITAVVGPNGSGKSNISDAVLWVLGERSARNLRGQAMEDIIFSGSAARKAVSFAEVELILDNSDGTLPMDFDEVSIARRMYRSGESEYLVNGTVARRLDVLDILHDSGLGTGTHSIISQGSLDSVLQSRPEDRRALIEEAAGVLKHKQRKEKSARKLASMDNHLARVRDVAAEVQRQLGPLERKAKRAKAYQEASVELAEVRLALAVDDLRALQQKWDSVCAAEKALDEEVESTRSAVDEAERKVNVIQEQIRQESQDAGELARRQRRCAQISERLDSAELLLRERRRSALAYEADVRMAQDSSRARRESALADLEAARAQLAEVESSSSEAEALVARLSQESESISARRRELEKAAEDIDRELARCERESDEAKREQTALQETLSNGLAHERLVQARKVELAGELEHVREEYEQACAKLEESKKTLADMEERDREAQGELVKRFDAWEQARSAHDAAREELHALESEHKALERAQRASRQDDPALLWLMDNADQFGGSLSPVAKALKAPGGLESLVERLLGDDLAALSVEDAKVAQEVAAALSSGGLAGDVSVFLRRDDASKRGASARGSKYGEALIDGLSYSDSFAPVVEALLGDVVICDTRAEAFEAHALDDTGRRFASRDGIVVWPNGRVRIFGAKDADEEGVLARERRIDDVVRKSGEVAKKVEEALAASEAAEAAYREMQATSLKLSQDLASQKGACDAARAEEERSSRRLSSLVSEVEDIDKQVEMARESVSNVRPDVEKVAERIARLAEERESLVEAKTTRAEEIAPVRADFERIAGELAAAKLQAATIAERRSYAERMLVARERDIEAIDESAAESRRMIALKKASIVRADELLAVVEALATGLQRRARIVDEALDASENASNSVHATAAEAREAARHARNAYDEVSERMTQAKVEKSRLEIQVEAAVNAVVRDCATPLERASELPVLEDRTAAEDAAFKLERRIRNMGTINPDAAEEYAELKERYDYLAGQLADMEAARKSLNRIVKVIDARMKDDFARTYEQVNANFSEIFSLLFPGGSATLALENPDDMENTGVEVTAQPRGKRITKMTLMSGGEKSLTALALLFAVYKTRSTPFYILDEVEAALDDTNLRRLVSYIDSLRQSTQLIMITHQRRTMEMADVLFGVSMQADGVTKVISQKLERALEQAE